MLIRKTMDAQAVERIVIAARKLIHSPQTSPRIVAMLKASKTPVAALAQTTTFVMKALYDESRGMPASAIYPAGKEVMQELADVAKAAGLFTASPQMFKEAFALILAALEKAQGQAAPAQAAPQGAPATAGIGG